MNYINFALPKPEPKERTRKPLKRSPIKRSTKRIKTKSSNPHAIARKRAWDAFSVWVRLSNADWVGNVACFTCGTVKPWRKMQAGHYFHGVLDFNHYNINPQCSRCNKWKQGEGTKYTEHLVQLYGVEIIEQLMIEKHQELSDVAGRTIEDYRAIEDTYKKKVEELK